MEARGKEEKGTETDWTLVQSNSKIFHASYIAIRTTNDIQLHIIILFMAQKIKNNC